LDKTLANKSVAQAAAADEEEDIDEENLVTETKAILHDRATVQVAQSLHVKLNDEVEEGLSDLDDDEEIQAMLDVSPEEIDFKLQIWTDENRDWILKQEGSMRCLPMVLFHC
jgi:transcription factor IIIB 90 kDa subunit